MAAWGFCSGGVLTVEGAVGRRGTPPIDDGDIVATRWSRAVGARLVPGGDAGHHTRDGYAPRKFGVNRFRVRTRQWKFYQPSTVAMNRAVGAACGLDEWSPGRFCSDGVLTVEGAVGRRGTPPIDDGDIVATRWSRAVGARLVPGGDAGHHTRDGYAPRKFGATDFECGHASGSSFTLRATAEGLVCALCSS